MQQILFTKVGMSFMVSFDLEKFLQYYLYDLFRFSSLAYQSSLHIHKTSVRLSKFYIYCSFNCVLNGMQSIFRYQNFAENGILKVSLCFKIGKYIRRQMYILNLRNTLSFSYFIENKEFSIERCSLNNCN